MDPLREIVRLDGFFTRAQAREAGYDDRAVAAAVRGKVWHRFRRGYFSFVDVWSTLDETEQHRVRCAAVLDSLGGSVALSHASACVAHRISLWDVDLSRVHVTRLDGGAGRLEGDVVHHEGVLTEDEVVDAGGLRAVTPVRAALEAGSRASGGAKLVPLDSLLHRGLATTEELEKQFLAMGAWPFMRSMHVPVRMADGRAESAGETLGRHLFRAAGLPAPELQWTVHAPDGRFVGTTDWAWPEHQTFGEFDGKVKYGRLLKPGQDPGEVVFAEKQREDDLRDVTDHRMFRMIFDDLRRPNVTADRLRRKLRKAG